MDDTMQETNIDSDIEEMKRKIAEISKQLGSNNISAEVIARYLETLQFPNNESGLNMIQNCLKKINRENGLKQAMEFSDLFIPEFRDPKQYS